MQISNPSFGVEALLRNVQLPCLRFLGRCQPQLCDLLLCISPGLAQLLLSGGLQVGQLLALLFAELLDLGRFLNGLLHLVFSGLRCLHTLADIAHVTAHGAANAGTNLVGDIARNEQVLQRLGDGIPDLLHLGDCIAETRLNRRKPIRGGLPRRLNVSTHASEHLAEALDRIAQVVPDHPQRRAKIVHPPPERLIQVVGRLGQQPDADNRQRHRCRNRPPRRRGRRPQGAKQAGPGRHGDAHRRKACRYSGRCHTNRCDRAGHANSRQRQSS